MTDKQLREAEKAAKRKAEIYLQMPPVVKPRTDPSVPLCKDHALLNHDSAKYVFTDITFGVNDKDRFVVIREPDGTLRHATWEERDRIVPIYFPKPGRELVKSKMFEGEHLTVSTLLENYFLAGIFITLHILLIKNITKSQDQ